jgi:hypothetical protein
MLKEQREVGAASPNNTGKRCVWFIIITLAVNIIPSFVIPPFSKDGFQLSILLLALMPVVWPLVLFFASKGMLERLVCYCSFLPLLFWLPAIYDEIGSLYIRYF